MPTRARDRGGGADLDRRPRPARLGGGARGRSLHRARAGRRCSPSTGLEPAWLGLTDAHGSLGRRAGLDRALSRTRAPRPARGACSRAAGPRLRPGRRARRGRGQRAGSASPATSSSARPAPAGSAPRTPRWPRRWPAEGHAGDVLFTGWPERRPAEPFDHWVAHYRELGIELQRLPQPTASWIETGHRHAVRAYEVYRLATRPRRRAVRRHPLPRGARPRLLRRLREAARGRARAHDARDRHPQLDQLGAGGERDPVPGARRLRRRLRRAPLRRALRRADQPERLHARLDAQPGWRLPERNFVQQYARSEAVDARRPGAAGPRLGDDRDRLLRPARAAQGSAGVLRRARPARRAPRPRAACQVTFLGKHSSVDGLDAGEYIGERAGAMAVAGRRRRRPRPAGGDRPPALAPDAGSPSIPSLADNSPNTVYEALALRIPLIASRVGGTAELIDAARPRPDHVRPRDRPPRGRAERRPRRSPS